MPVSYVPFDLQMGYIHHWLVAGPQAIEAQPLELLGNAASKVRVAQYYYEQESGIRQLPVEPGPLPESTFTVGGREAQWAYVACAEDHFVDLTDVYAAATYLRAWAYTQLVCADAQRLLLTLTTNGPTDLWLNGTHIQRGDSFDNHSSALEVTLHEGVNELLVRFEQVCAGACLHRFALRITEPAGSISTQIPTAIEDIAHRNQLASIFNQAYLDRDVFPSEEMIAVHWPDDLEASDDLIIRLQTPSARIYAESKASAAPGQSWSMVQAYQAPQGPLRLRFMPPLELYYDENLRVLREIPLWGMGRQAYSETVYGTYPERRLEALRHARRGRDDLFAESAKMALGQWEAVDVPVMLRSIGAIRRGEIDSPLCLVGLLGILHRWGEHDKFPTSLCEPLEACILGFTGWADAPNREGLGVEAESTQILLYAGEILAGQLYPKRTFADSGKTGQWHRERGERSALAWLRQRSAGGFADWDSGRAFEAELIALAHLMDLAETEGVWQMVGVILDKLLFTIALNAYRGVFGATQGAADVTSIKGGLLAPTSGIIRLLWGEGVFNHHLAGLVSIACMEDYQLPPLMPAIATTRRDELWNRECHRVGAGQTVNKVTYRTPDYLLASAQDYRPGERGRREHIWQATLGPEAVVYTTHPASMGRSAGHRPGFWLGNATLPRVAQWKDVLLAVYRLADEDWMGYTHAYFPAYAFDASVVRESPLGQTWAFAQQGEGYLALTAFPGLEWIIEGPGAYQELRAYGQNVVWCCQMGRAALDGTFEAFQERVLSRFLKLDGLTVQFETLRDETLTFGWEGPLVCNGEAQALSGFKHYENPYTVTDLDAPEMEIQSEQYLLRLRFE